MAFRFLVGEHLPNVDAKYRAAILARRIKKCENFLARAAWPDAAIGAVSAGTRDRAVPLAGADLERMGQAPGIL